MATGDNQIRGLAPRVDSPITETVGHPSVEGATEAFKRHDAASYDEVTDAYDRFTQACTTPIVERMLDRAGVGGGQRVLDVGTGTGIVARHVARRLSPNGYVTAGDLSEGMLRHAAAGLSADLAERVAFVRLDAERLAIRDAAFDAVTSLYALRHFPHPEAALAEMHRVLKPGGTLIVGVGSSAPRSVHAAWRLLPRVRDALLARVGRRLTAPDMLHRLMDEYLPAAQEREESEWAERVGSGAAVVIRMVRDAGFGRVESEWIPRTLVLDSADDFWELQITFSSRARKRVAAAPEEHVEAMRREFDSRCNKVKTTGGRLIYPYAALLVQAMKA